MNTPTSRFLDTRLSDLSEEERKHLIRLAILALKDEHQAGRMLASSRAVRDYLQLILGGLKDEHFGVVFLNTQHQVLGIKTLLHGTIDGAVVYPRRIIREVLDFNAAAVIFYHNHPSGSAQPSQADIEITAKLKRALGAIDVRVLDHLVISSQDAVSMSERSLI